MIAIRRGRVANFESVTPGGTVRRPLWLDGEPMPDGVPIRAGDEIALRVRPDGGVDVLLWPPAWVGWQGRVPK